MDRALDAVIFDMDGTLVDTERLGFKGWDLASAELGVEVPHDLVVSFVGHNEPAVLAMLTDALGDPDLSRRVFELHWQKRRELAETELEPKRGALWAVRELKGQGYRLAVASSSPREMIELNLSRTGMLDAFDIITDGTEVENGKPAPDIFLLAAEKLGADPARCAVVEDSPNGVRAGHAAGMSVYLVPDVITPTPEIASLAHEVLPSLEELPAALDRLLL